jgi:prevent-host-death family protein
MTISVTELKARCLEIIREVQRGGKVVDIVRHGQVVARLLPAVSGRDAGSKPWEVLRGTGELLAAADESVLDEHEFEASR